MMRSFIQNNPELSFILSFLAACWVVYQATGAIFGAFIGTLLASFLDPIVIIAAIISAICYAEKKYLRFLGIAFLLGFIAGVVQSILSAEYRQSLGFSNNYLSGLLLFTYFVAVPLLANIINLLRAWFKSPQTPEEAAPQPEDVSYFLKHHSDKPHNQ